MKFTDFTLTRSEQQVRDTEECIRRMKEDKTLLQCMNANGLALNLIERYPWRISRWYEGVKPCISCKGLESCTQKDKGYYENLSFDGILQVVHTACAYERRRIQEEAHMNNYLVSDLPDSLRTVTFDKISTGSEKMEYLQVLSEAMEACEEKRGLYLYGTMGSGKTYLSACACNYHALHGESVAFIHYPSFCRRMANMVHEGEYKTEFNRLCFSKFLVIDDIGAESVTEWNRDQILLPLLSTRYEAGLTTWFTSNEDLISLEKHFRFSNKGKEEEVKASRIIERIEHLSKVQAVTSKDRRKQL